MKNRMIPVITSEADSFNWYSLAICVAPFPINTRKKEIRIMINGLNFASQDTMMAVNPRPPAVLVEIVWEDPLTSRNPVKPQIAPDNAMVRMMTLFT